LSRKAASAGGVVWSQLEAVRERPTELFVCGHCFRLAGKRNNANERFMQGVVDLDVFIP